MKEQLEQKENELVQLRKEVGGNTAGDHQLNHKVAELESLLGLQKQEAKEVIQHHLSINKAKGELGFDNYFCIDF